MSFMKDKTNDGSRIRLSMILGTTGRNSTKSVYRHRNQTLAMTKANPRDKAIRHH